MKYKINILLIVFMGAIVFTSSFFNAQAYSPDITHFPMAENAVDLYNTYYPDSSLTAQERNWIALGANDEDESARPFNHFYDPVYQRGMPGYLTSKDWAHSAEAQWSSGVYTWEEAIAAYERGDREKAYKALGHIFHLIQDATVPAHTRHDPHPPEYTGYGGLDPYETASKGFLSLENLNYSAPVIYGDVDTYFDRVASYTNSHFLSKDSLGFYENPVPIKIEGSYLYGEDDEGEYKLMKVRRTGTVFFTDEIQIHPKAFSDPLVTQDYWNRLAPTAVENTAGIIKLFRDTVNEPEPKEENSDEGILSGVNNFFKDARTSAASTWMSTKSTFGQVVGFFDFFASSVQINMESGPKPVLPISTGVVLPTVTFNADLENQKEKNNALEKFQNQIEETVQVQEEVPEIQVEQEIPEVPEVEQSITQYLVTRVIDGDTIEIEGGEHVRYIGINTPEIPNGCFSQEATDYNSQLVLNKYIAMEEMPGQNEDVYGRLLRYVYTDDKFVNKELVETGHAYAYDYGTNHPYKSDFEIAQNTAKNNRSGLWGDACHPQDPPEIKGYSTDNAYNQGNMPSFGQSAPYGPAGPGLVAKNLEAVEESEEGEEGNLLDYLVITEIQIAGASSVNDEYIIIHNPTSEDVSLEGWSIQRMTKSGKVYKKNFESEHTIIAGGYFKIANSKSSKDITDSADMVHNSFALTKNNTVFLVNLTKKLITGEEETIVDKVGYGDAFSPELDSAINPEAGERLVRINNESLYTDTDNNSEDFEIEEYSPEISVSRGYESDDFFIQNDLWNEGENIYPGEIILGDTTTPKQMLKITLSGPEWPGTLKEDRIRWFMAKGSVLGVSTTHIISSLQGGFVSNSCWDGECVASHYKIEHWINHSSVGGLQSGDVVWFGFYDSFTALPTVFDNWINSEDDDPEYQYIAKKYYFQELP